MTARLVAALVAGDPPPDGFSHAPLAAAAAALRRKRAQQAARTWPMLSGAFGKQWTGTFSGWAASRPPRGGWLDGFGFAVSHRDALEGPAAIELAMREARWRYRPDRPPRRRLAPLARRVWARRRPGEDGRPAEWVVGVLGRIWVVALPRPVRGLTGGPHFHHLAGARSAARGDRARR